MKRWRVDTFARLNSVLLLSAVNLPGGELVSFGIRCNFLLLFVFLQLFTFMFIAI